ncbi:MAG: TIR domain-containing protein [Myxococcota bacterium]
MTPTRVFISYSHDSEAHRERVRSLAERLRHASLDAWIDRFEPYPKQGWPRWMEEQLDVARFVLVVCTPRYRQRFEAPDATGGVTWESVLARNDLYAQGGRNTDTREFVPVWFSDADRANVPRVLAHLAGHDLSTEAELSRLERRLRGEVETSVPPLGAAALGGVDVSPAFTAAVVGLGAMSAPPSDRASARRALRELLARLFDPEELRSFLRDVGREDVVGAVAWSRARDTVVGDTLDALHRYGGLDEVLDALLVVRPRESVEIGRVRGTFL